MKKILIACPTSSHKDYCLTSWVENIVKIAKAYDKTGKNIGVLVIDNSQNINHYGQIQRCIVQKCKEADNYTMFVGVKSHYKQGITLRSLMAECNNLIAKFVLNNNIDYLLSIESDIFPRQTIINDLLDKKPTSKKIVAAPYFLFAGSESKSIMFDIDDFGNQRIAIPVDTDKIFIDTNGQLHESQQLGLGCAMIHRNILKEIKFRIDTKDTIGTHADSFFYEDCRNKGIKLYFDTSNYAIHINGNWGKINKTT